MDIRTAQYVLGGDISGNSLSCPGPNHGKHDRSLRVTFTADDFIAHSFCGDDWQECKDYVRTMLGLSRDWKPDPSKFMQHEPSVTDDDKKKFALDIWRQSKKPKDTIVERYLAERCIDLDTSVQCLRFHPSLKFEGQQFPAMVALFRDIATNEPVGIHRTFINADFTKAGRKMLGSVRGAAIKLDPDEDLTYGLHIGEGIETCLAARIFAMKPAWALASTSNITNFPVIQSLTSITFLSEDDKNGSNRKSIFECGKRYFNAGIEVKINDPKTEGDMNDALKAKRNGQ